ncbi:MAG: hypothetical protein FWD80_01235 [Propionibacteriaceae bacterium]|nr:hypothetical protein [Propionibacteriaceae bacterium]
MSSSAADRSARPRLSALGRWALFWTLFIGVGALFGAAMMWIAPAKLGMAPLLDQMQANLPLADVFFTSFAWPGVFLLVIIGLPNLAGAALVARQHRIAPIWTTACGVVLIAWICLQLFVAFGPNPVSDVYLAFGLAQAVMGILWIRRARRDATIQPH